jgi:membrane protein
MAFINPEKFAKIKKLAQHPALDKPVNAYAKQEYTTPLFVLRETLAGFTRHNAFGMAASLSFYALFALIPLVLLIFFLLSHLVFSSDYAIVKLAILTGNLVPEFSSKIMVEVYSATQTKAAWGALGLFVLLWTITPLASAMRSAFYTISSMVEAPSYFKRKFKDVVSVLGILLLFFLFTSAGFIIEKIIRFLAVHLPIAELNAVGAIGTLLLTTLLIIIFYKVFFPMRVAFITGRLFNRSVVVINAASIWFVFGHQPKLWRNFWRHENHVCIDYLAIFKLCSIFTRYRANLDLAQKRCIVAKRTV